MALFTQYAVAAADEAMSDSGLGKHMRGVDRWDRTRIVRLFLHLQAHPHRSPASQHTLSRPHMRDTQKST